MKNNILLIIILFLGIALFGLYELKTIKKTDNSNNFPNNPNNFPNITQPPIQSPPPVQSPTQPNPAPVTPSVVPNSYQEALKIGEQTNKKIVLMFSADWCGWCKKFKSEVLTNSDVKETLKNYVFFIVDADQNRTILSKFGVNGLPNFIIIDYKENQLKNKAGYMSSVDFIDWLKSIENNPNPIEDSPADGVIVRRPIIRRPIGGGCGPGSCGPGGCGGCGSAYYNSFGNCYRN